MTCVFCHIAIPQKQLKLFLRLSPPLKDDAFPSCSTQAFAQAGLESATNPSISWLVHGHESLQLVWEHVEHATCPALVRDSPPLAQLYSTLPTMIRLIASLEFWASNRTGRYYAQSSK